MIIFIPWIYDDLWAFIIVSVFILILVHLVRWFKSCWCEVHSHRNCLSFSVCFQSLLEIVAQVQKKCSPAFCQVLPSKTTHLFWEEKQNALNEVGGFNARNRHHNNRSIALIEDFSTMIEPLKASPAACWTLALPKVRLLASVCHDNVVAYKEACPGKGRGEVYLSVYLSSGGERKEFRYNSKWKLISFIVRR